MKDMRRSLAADERGQVTAFVVIITAACLLAAGLVLDGGLALSAKSRAIGQAQEAARAGAQELDLAAYRRGTVRLNPAAARAAAQRYLHSVGASGTVTADVNLVRVRVDARQRTQLLGLVGIAEVTVSGRGQAHPDLGALGGNG
ncbi:TadE/TadG family type IV pilus assembly protein [Haloechinothrix salitolerans]|uniref:TadE/TadG family type IV pilus assembly protein n=1 Tax=Haloechinothrix salitolerans TaxID=926830 RepID=A0ABW2BXJ5_9PSEU